MPASAIAVIKLDYILSLEHIIKLLIKIDKQNHEADAKISLDNKQ